MELEFYELELILEARRHTILWGPPGTGKTHAATHSQQHVYSVTLTTDTPAAELRGHYIPKGSEFMWHDGPCIRAWREGARLVLNEIDRTSGDAETLLYALLDDPDVARLTLPTGETVRPTAGFQCVATTNVNPRECLPEALLDRFAIRCFVDEPHPQALDRLTPALRNMVTETLTYALDRKVSLRQALAYQSLSDQLGDPQLAARAVFGARGRDIFNALALAGAPRP